MQQSDDLLPSYIGLHRATTSSIKLPEKRMCNCKVQRKLVDISNSHSEFKSRLSLLETGNWVLLMRCPECGQLWKLDEWDKYRPCYAVKIASRKNWQEFDSTTLVKDKIIENRVGLIDEPCHWSGCGGKQVKGSAYCIDHLWSTGARA